MARTPELSAATYRQMASVMKTRGKKQRENYFLNRASQAWENPLPARKSGTLTTVPLPGWGSDKAGKRWDYGPGGAQYGGFTGKKNPGDGTDRQLRSMPGGGAGGRMTPPPASGGGGRITAPGRTPRDAAPATTSTVRSHASAATSVRRQLTGRSTPPRRSAPTARLANSANSLRGTLFRRG